MDLLFNIIELAEEFLWGYIGWVLIVAIGIYLTIYSKALQFKVLYNFQENLKSIFAEGKKVKHKNAINPFKLYFASVGGMVGLGNIVMVGMAVMIGGPGAVFWIIIASLSGMLMKYCEIYLGVKYRIKNEQGGFDGGPIYFLQEAFNGKLVAYIFALFFCFYSIEISNFIILVDRIEGSFQFNRYLIIFFLLFIVLYSSIGGIKRLANICSIIMPFFMIFYILLAIYIIVSNIEVLPSFLMLVMKSAFTGHAKLGGFIGSTGIMAAYMGISKTVYSGDICVGYDSIVQSETNIDSPEKQAKFAIYALFTDSFICILTNLVIGVTGAWYRLNELKPSDIISNIFQEYLLYSDIFMTCLFFFAGFTTIIAYLTVGMKCAKFIHKKYGTKLYLAYAVFAFIYFCHFPQEKIISFMGLLSGLLLLINLFAIVKLHKKIKFN